jgi:hypothetical protein
MPALPRGIISDVTAPGIVGLELTVRVDGLGRNYLFGIDEVEILCEDSGGPSTPHRS